MKTLMVSVVLLSCMVLRAGTWLEGADGQPVSANVTSRDSDIIAPAQDKIPISAYLIRNLNLRMPNPRKGDMLTARSVPTLFAQGAMPGYVVDCGEYGVLAAMNETTLSTVSLDEYMQSQKKGLEDRIQAKMTVATPMTYAISEGVAAFDIKEMVLSQKRVRIHGKTFRAGEGYTTVCMLLPAADWYGKSSWLLRATRNARPLNFMEVRWIDGKPNIVKVDAEDDLFIDAEPKFDFKNNTRTSCRFYFLKPDKNKPPEIPKPVEEPAEEEVSPEPEPEKGPPPPETKFSRFFGFVIGGVDEISDGGKIIQNKDGTYSRRMEMKLAAPYSFCKYARLTYTPKTHRLFKVEFRSGAVVKADRKKMLETLKAASDAIEKRFGGMLSMERFHSGYIARFKDPNTKQKLMLSVVAVKKGGKRASEYAISLEDDEVRMQDKNL